ncbi:MAG: peptidase M48 Ste24p [Bradyrhizobiaceae bacterium]|nr:MAG: peptidase M48 Ste24p [Bradyrhizobiaceae bacterium]
MAQAYGLYTHIRANWWRSILLLVGLFVLFYVVLFALNLGWVGVSADGPLDWLVERAWANTITGLPIATLAGGVWLVIAYFFHQSIIDAVTGGHAVTRTENPRLYNLLENLCISRGIPMPRLKVMETSALNAFASGLNQRQYAITVTSGLLGSLDDAEVEAVLAHELTHIRNGDVRMMVIAVIIAGVIGFVAEIFFRGLFRGSFRFGRGGGSSNRKGGGGAILIAVVLIALAWLLSVVIRFALSRRREFLADAGAVELTKNPDAMISALRKIENRGELEGVTSAVMEMCVDNPREGFADLFATHPSIESRVVALVNFAGGHDPGPLLVPEEDAAAPDAARESEHDGSIADPSSAPAEPEKPFPPGRPPVELGAPQPGPWGPAPDGRR